MITDAWSEVDDTTIQNCWESFLVVWTIRQKKTMQSLRRQSSWQVNLESLTALKPSSTGTFQSIIWRDSYWWWNHHSHCHRTKQWNWCWQRLWFFTSTSSFGYSVAKEAYMGVVLGEGSWQIYAFATGAAPPAVCRRLQLAQQTTNYPWLHNEKNFFAN